MTVGDLIRDRAEEDPERPFVSFEASTMSYGDYLVGCLRVAKLLSAKLVDPPHVGVLMENRPEYLEILGGAALCGAVVVGINATRREPELERDIRHTDCGLVVVDEANAPLLELLDVPETLLVGSTYDDGLAGASGNDERWQVEEGDLYLLIFTSGTTGAPKAVRCSHRRMVGRGRWSPTWWSSRVTTARTSPCRCSTPTH